MFEALGAAAAVTLQPDNIWYAILGFLIGAVGGAMPGIGGPLVLTLMMPFTIGMSPESAMILLIGAYTGGQYAGSIPSILINTPGNSSSAAAVFDGYPLAKQGEGVTAIAVSATASGIGSILGGILLILIAPLLMQLVMLFGSPEFFMLGVVGLAVIVSISRGSLLKGLIAGALGALVASIGTSLIRAQPRYTMGIPELYDGINLVAAFIGVFAVAEMMRLAGQRGGSIAAALSKTGSRIKGIWWTLKEWWTLLKSTAIGIALGVVPGEGGTVAAFVAYGEAKRSSKEPERYGKGHPGGLVAADAANNSVISGSLVPTLAFGIPGSNQAAILLAALMLHAVRPGPDMFGADIQLTYTMILAVIVGGVATLVLGLAFAKQLGLLSLVPTAILIPCVIVVSMLGSYVLAFNFMLTLQALVFGIIGYTMIRFGFSVVPFILGLILGPLAELNLSRTVQLAGDQNVIWFILQRPLSMILFLIILVLLFSDPIKRLLKSLRQRRNS
ncbi:tripartite tricarboxylate transporter permease [Rhodobacteraceae bacterium 2376]|uniref:Tripartite tricarboxylate transporter permease n=1 Tax=Rhabdonatronobacter sediminivivens TaxID=2743469 RepID=A0A7Z0HXW9_9RHOB|nr:tripartite tricarboxylate transporter permease [Rhabdonatronobacter sediminivivens]NYS24267.1 tripartite tricarboxylate transporter permease [Rhabdonatronobacter sediminivivens]